MSSIRRVKDTVSFKAKDGHSVDSEYEARVDDLLTWYELPHRVHSPVPGFGGHKTDFIVSDVHIEVWGKDDGKYNSDREEKEKFYKTRKIKLVGFEKDDFTDMMKLHRKISEIRAKMQGRQKNIIEKQKDGYQEPVDRFGNAEKHAKEDGVLDETEHEISVKRAKLDECRQKCREIEDEIKKLNEDRNEIIKSHLSRFEISVTTVRS